MIKVINKIHLFQTNYLDWEYFEDTRTSPSTLKANLDSSKDLPRNTKGALQQRCQCFLSLLTGSIVMKLPSTVPRTANR